MTLQFTADEYRAKATECRARSLESYERCDTDGFLSQWAADEMARRYDHAAEVAENGGKIETLALFFGGELASLDQRSGQWGLYWILNDQAKAAFGKGIWNGSKARNSVERDRAKGFTYGTLEVEAQELASGAIVGSIAALESGQFEIIRTDGAYAHIEADERAAVSA